MAYVSITRLGMLIQDKLNKLNAGNLSAAELDELKELTTELNERIVILQYKAHESQLLKMADQIITEKKPDPAPVKQEPEITEPIKLNFGAAVNKPVEPVKPLINDVPVEEKTVVESKPSKVAQTMLVSEEPAVVEKKEPVIEKKEPVVEKKEAVAEKPADVQPTGKLSLAERMQKTKVDDLSKAIGLNQKFLFMNYLFEGENSSYNDAIDKLNKMPTAADARHYIRELAYIYSWNYEDENVVLFTEYVERRYL